MLSPKDWVHAAVGLQSLPIIVAISARTGFQGARRWIAVWFAMGLGFDIVMVYLGSQGINNHWLGYAATPAMGVLALSAMATWQRDDLARVAVRLMMPLSLVTWLALLVAVEDADSFSRVTEPMYDLVCLAVAVLTMGVRGLREEDPLLRQDWFWFCAAFALYYGASAAVAPLGALLVDSRPDLIVRALTMEAVLDIVAYSLAAIGFLCRPQNRSGAWSLPSPSPWPSSWSPSERPS
jgi:hypothetical protein